MISFPLHAFVLVLPLFHFTPCFAFPMTCFTLVSPHHCFTSPYSHLTLTSSLSSHFTLISSLPHTPQWAHNPCLTSSLSHTSPHRCLTLCSASHHLKSRGVGRVCNSIAPGLRAPPQPCSNMTPDKRLRLLRLHLHPF